MRYLVQTPYRIIMNMLYSLAMFITYFTEMLISYIFFSQAAAQKYKLVRCCLIGTGLFFVGMLINVFFKNTVWLNVIAFVLINIAFSRICFDITPLKSIFYSVELGILSNTLEFGAIFLISAITKTEVTAYVSQLSFFVLDVAVSKSLYLITCVIIIRFMKTDKHDVKFPIAFCIYPVAALCVMLESWYICTTYEISDKNQILLSIVNVVLFLSIFVLLIFYQHNIEKENEHMEFRSEYYKILNEKNYYDILERQNNELCAYAHDAKNHLLAIKNLNTNLQIDNYLNQMSESLESYSNVAHSGNTVLDVIINKYVSECSIKNLEFTYDVKLRNLNYVDPYDLVAILGNLLDNALETAEKSKCRKMSLETDYRNIYDVVIISNSCDQPPKTMKKELVTTKPNKQIHGIGLKNVKKTLEKYGGDFGWDYDDTGRIFTCTVMLQSNQVKNID